MYLVSPLSLSKIYFLDDFCGGNYDNYSWCVGITGTSTVTKISALGGQVELTAAIGYAAELNGSANRNFSLVKNAVVRWRCKLMSATNLQINIGLIDTVGWAQYVLWSCDTGSYSTWHARTSDGSSSTSVDSGVSLDTNWHSFEINCKSSQCEFLLDNVLYNTISTTLPTGNLAPYIYIYSNSGASKSLRADWIELMGDRN